ncbi:MAG: UDP-N-acetylmuramoyl-tripeptide--D-alanyl-D-alanine ligase [Nostocoides sp.]
MTLGEIAEVTNGWLSDPAAGDVQVDGPVVTDSREAGPRGLYIARIGEHADGHEFVLDAAERGAVAALTTEPVTALPYVLVPDVQEAFAALARAVVERAGEKLTIIGITGSCGKTSTKDLLAHVLSGSGNTVAPVGSLNSEVGVPLTVCRITAATRFLVLELGARGIGHVAYLTDMAPPKVGVILNVGSAHLGEFGSQEAIARAKGELVEALPPAADGGIAVLNADDPLVAAMAARTSARVVRVGEDASADIRAIAVTVGGDGHPSATVVTPTGRAEMTLTGLVGRHHLGNALAVIAVARACGISLEAVCDALGAARPSSRWRMEVHTTPAGATIVNDAYNANPDSMLAALQTLGIMTATGRRVAVLGAMLELGETSAELHARMGVAAVANDIDDLIVVGAGARPIAEAATAAPDHGEHRTTVRTVPDVDAAYAVLARDLHAGDIVLIKSSRDAELRFLGDRLISSEGAS